MALPTPVKTWLISANNTLLTNGSTNTDYQGRTKDIADFLGTVVSQILSLSGGLITCVGSSDGVANTSPPTFNALNYWVSGSTNFRNQVYGIFSTPLTTNTLWIVLDFPEGQLMMCFHKSATLFIIGWSASKVYAAPSTSTDRPTAADESILYSFTSTNYDNYGMWNQDNLSIVNQSNSYSSYTQQVQVGLTSDALGFYAVSFRANVPCFMMWFGKLQNPVWTTPPNDWGSAYVMMISGNQNIRQVVGPFYDSVAYNPKSTIPASPTNNRVQFVVPCIGSNAINIYSGNYDIFPGNPYQYGGAADADSGTYTLSPIGLYSPARTGIKGLLTDLWWGPGNGNTYTYPASAPTAPDFFQANDLVFPWDGLTNINFS